ELRRVEQARHSAGNGSSAAGGFSQNGSAPIQNAPAPSLQFPGYRIIREIFRGGQGIVYQAFHPATGRNVALKLMRDAAHATRHEQARFQREVQILGQLRHPHIVAIHDSGLAAGMLYYVMDYIEWRPVDEWLAGERGGRTAPGR